MSLCLLVMSEATLARSHQHGCLTTSLTRTMRQCQSRCRETHEASTLNRKLQATKVVESGRNTTFQKKCIDYLKPRITIKACIYNICKLNRLYLPFKSHTTSNYIIKYRNLQIENLNRCII